MKFLARRLNLLLTSLLLVFGVWLGWLASSEGFTQSWREAIRREFAAQGIELSMGRLTLDPLHGLVAHDVRLYEDEDREQVLAEIDRIDLNISVPSLLRKEIHVKSIQIRDAEITLRLQTTEGAEKIVVASQCGARMHFAPDEIEVKELRGRLFGVHLSFAGELVRGRPDAETEAPNRPENLLANLGDWPARVAEWMENIETNDADPTELQIRALANTSRLNEGRYQFSLRSPSLRIAGHPLVDVSAQAVYDNGAFTVDGLRMRDHGGAMRADIAYMSDTRALVLNLESHSALIDALRRACWPAQWPELEVTDAPMLTLGGELRIGGAEEPWWPVRGLITGSMAIGTGNIGGVPLAYGSASFSLDDSRFFMRDLRLRSATGEFRGDLIRDSEAWRLQGLSTVHPEELSPIAWHPIASGILESFRCDSRSQTEIALTFTMPHGTDNPARDWSLDSRFSASGVRYNGVMFREASGRWTHDAGEHRFHQVAAVLAEGARLPRDPQPTPGPTTATADSIKLSGPGPLITFENLKAEGWPELILAAFAPAACRALPAFRHPGSGILVVDGPLHPSLGGNTNLRMSFRSDEILYWPVARAELPLEKPDASIVLENNAIRIPRLRADLFGGRADARLRFDNATRQKPDLSGTVALNDVNYQDLMALFNAHDDDSRGDFGMSITFQAPRCELDNMSGSGSMRLSNGDIFSIPVLGPLSPLVAAALPDTGFGYSVASEASADFAISQGTLTTRNFTAYTPSFQMETSGTVNLATGDLDLTSRLNARGIARVATTWISHIFEYKSNGKLGDPRWHAHRIPRLPLPKFQVVE